MKKKFMSVMLAATLIVSLVGCGKKNNNNTATDADDTSNKAITAKEYNATIASNAAVIRSTLHFLSIRELQCQLISRHLPYRMMMLRLT